ncbi:MAG TPA: PAS domain S-box protein [Thermodesulfatator sp.]|nr:PAS domain S-box protein [Thermodesulfatator sp.]
MPVHIIFLILLFGLLLVGDLLLVMKLFEVTGSLKGLEAEGLVVALRSLASGLKEEALLSLAVGVVAAVAMVAFWITLRREQRHHRICEQRLRELSERLRALVEASPRLGIVRIRLPHGEFIDVNRGACELLSLSRGELLGRSLLDFVYHEDKEAMAKGLYGLKEGEMAEMVFRFVSGIGRIFPAEWHLFRPRSDFPDSEAVGIFTDVTDREAAEAERLLRERLQGVLEMAGAAAHEINQPLQILAGIAWRLKERCPQSQECHKIIDQLEEEVERMMTLGHKLASVSRYAVKPYVGETKIIDLEAASYSSETGSTETKT